MTSEAPMVAEIEKAPRVALLEAWTELFEGSPPPYVSVRLLRLMIADEIQWRASGRSRPALLRRLAKLAGDAPSDGKPSIARESTGTRWSGPRFFGVRT